jgi:hypothetical protein
MFEFKLQECRNISRPLEAVGDDTEGGIVTKKWHDKWVEVSIPACICCMCICLTQVDNISLIFDSS